MAIIKSFQLTGEPNAIVNIINQLTNYTDIEILTDSEDEEIEGLLIGKENEDKLLLSPEQWINIYPDGKLTITDEPE